MPRLLRPHIPLEVECRVALRQLGEMWPDKVIGEWRYGPRNRARNFTLLRSRLLAQLCQLLNCEPVDLRLDHDPALGAREKVFNRNGKHVGYVPDANDPEYLIYREKHAHHIKTNVRGDGAQHPDRVLIKKNRRIERGPRPKRGPPIRSRGFQKGPKRPWGKRSFAKKGRPS